jgi:hypothetical protein
MFAGAVPRAGAGSPWTGNRHSAESRWARLGQQQSIRENCHVAPMEGEAAGRTTDKYSTSASPPGRTWQCPDQPSRSATVTARVAARNAGKRPPTKPTPSAHCRPRGVSSGVNWNYDLAEVGPQCGDGKAVEHSPSDTRTQGLTGEGERHGLQHHRHRQPSEPATSSATAVLSGCLHRPGGCASGPAGPTLPRGKSIQPARSEDCYGVLSGAT